MFLNFNLFCTFSLPFLHPVLNYFYILFLIIKLIVNRLRHKPASKTEILLKLLPFVRYSPATRLLTTTSPPTAYTPCLQQVPTHDYLLSTNEKIS
jgi:hypothetical protein